MATRGILRMRAARLADAENSPRWDMTAGAQGEVDQLLAVAYDQAWIGALNAVPTLRLGRRACVAGSDGRVPMTQLDAGAGDGLERLYRIQRVTVDRYALQAVNWRDYGNADLWNVQDRVWWREGAFLMLLPKAPLGASEVVVSHLPQRLDLVSTDNVVIPVPDPAIETMFEQVIALETGAMMLAKGGSEDPNMLLAQSAELRQQMLAELARLYAGPMPLSYADSAADWAG